jgi:hypothetical protein
MSSIPLLVDENDEIIIRSGSVGHVNQNIRRMENIFLPGRALFS